MQTAQDEFEFNPEEASPSSPYQPQTPKKKKYGVTMPTDPSKFTGYDFAAHQGQEFDYDNPAEGAKYAVSNYLNNIDPNSDWAGSAAEALNSQFGQNIFKANGGRRLSYGDEFVDSDPTRFGGKFFWGSSGPSMSVGGSAGGGSGLSGSAGAAGLSGGGSVQDAIMRLLMQGQQPVTRESVRQQYEPAAAAMERGTIKARAESAQRRAVEGTGAQGGGGGANDSDVNSINENAADSQSNLMASLMGDEIQARRQQVVQALQFAQGDQRMQLERQLAEMDNQLRRTQMNNQNQQFYDQFSYNMSQNNQNSILSQLLSLFS